mgnify:CR=1 FL=1
MANVIFSSADVQKNYEELISKGVEFTQIPQKQPWDRTIAIFKDIDGNTFCIGSKD